jgi:hypothetical protein
MQEYAATVAQVDAVKFHDLMPRNGEAALREPFIFVFSKQLVISNDANLVAAGDVSLGLNGLPNAATGFFSKGQRIFAKILLVLTKNSWTEPEFADIDISQQFFEAEAVVLVRMSQDKNCKIRALPAFGQVLDEPINDRSVRVAFFFRKTQMVDVDLHNHVFSHTNRCAIASSNGPLDIALNRQGKIFVGVRHCQPPKQCKLTRRTCASKFFKGSDAGLEGTSRPAVFLRLLG